MAGGHPNLINILSAFCFAGFVLAGLGMAAWRKPSRGATRRKARVSGFLSYALVASFGAGLTQRDLWPFSAWPIVSLVARPTIVIPKLVGVDTRGEEHAVDYRALQPLGIDELSPWLLFSFPRLPPAAQDRAAAHLLETVEQARRRALEGRGVGSFERFLGPLTAPYFLLHPKIWSGPAGIPALPFVRLRLYKETWTRSGGIVGHALDYEYPRP